MTEQELNKLIGLVYKYTKIKLNETKKQMLTIRLNSRLKALALSSFTEYIKYLETNESELQPFVDSVTTNETYFFRTHRIWSYLEDEYIKNFIKENGNKTLNIWSAACSSGDEPYSLAMTLENLKNKFPNLKYKILATDISDKVLTIAKNGIYKGRTIDMLTKSKPEFKQKYFDKIDDSYHVKNCIKDNITFKKHNLFNDLGVRNHFNLVLLRNVLIYFAEKDQENVINNISKTSTRDGVLIIGESESISRYSTDYKYLAPLFYQKNSELVMEAS